MKTFLHRYSGHTYALFRFMAGLMFVFHGTQKLFGYPGNRPPANLLSLRGLAGIIEVGGGSMIAIGLFAAWAAFIASGTMAFAYFIGHASEAFLPIVNKGELAVLYCFAFLYIASKGAGGFSVDAALARRHAP